MNQDRSLFLSLAGVLLCLGVFTVFSGSATSRPSKFEQVYLSRHVAFLAIGIAAAAASAALPVRVWYRSAPWLFGLTVLLLGMVLLPGFGTRVHGAQRWFRYGAFSIQPSELAKISLPMTVCYCLSRHSGSTGRTVKGTIWAVFPILLVVPLVVHQPDLGTALFLAAGGTLALFAGGWQLRYFALTAVVILPVACVLVPLEPYQSSRINGFRAVWSNLDAAPYQLKQSLVALGAGGIWGVGIGKGWQKLSFLPEANTDFIFSVVGEELGLVGTLGLIFLWCGIYAAGLRLLRQVERGSFAHMVGFTLLTQLVVQGALNVAVATAMVPPKGIPHPLLSYGGSNLIISIVTLGIIVSMSRERADITLSCGSSPEGTAGH